MTRRKKVDDVNLCLLTRIWIVASSYPTFISLKLLTDAAHTSPHAHPVEFGIPSYRDLDVASTLYIAVMPE
jgi:hypothetical protein